MAYCRYCRRDMTPSRTLPGRYGCMTCGAESTDPDFDEERRDDPWDGVDRGVLWAKEQRRKDGRANTH